MSRFIFTLGVLCWVGAVAYGFVIIERYSLSPGKDATPGPWPGDTLLSLDTQKPTLLMFAHPLCPCTRSCFEELSRTLARMEDTVSASIVFTVPKNDQASWKDTALFRHASETRGLHVLTDTAGAEAQRFNVYTSGTILVYDTHGRLLFNGGITPARGHEGDNDGRALLEKVLREGTGETITFPVFGCGLVEAVPGS